MEQLGAVAEQNEGGGLHPGLGDIEHLEPPALVRGRLDPDRGVGQHAVEGACGDPHGVVGGHGVHGLENLVHPEPRQGRDKQHRGVGHIGQGLPDGLLVLVHGFGVLLHRVPLVDQDHRGLSGLMDQTGDFRVLLRDALVGVHHNEAHVRPGDGVHRAHVGELLHAVVHSGLLPHAGGVDEHVFPVFIFEVAVDGVPGGTGHVGDNDTLLPQDVI